MLLLHYSHLFFKIPGVTTPTSVSNTCNRSNTSLDSPFQNPSIVITFITASSHPSGIRGPSSGHLAAANSTSALRVHDRSISHVP